jgi:2-iminobutanoate/2-iminopropanoate deaminase
MNGERNTAMAKRKSINYPGFKHENPIPNASCIGNILMSSIISGRDPGTGQMPSDLAGQVTNLFAQIKLCVEAAGGSVDDIIKVNFWMKDPATGRAALNGEWARMFPDPESRPARHTLALPANAANHVTCDFTAVIGG